MPKHITNSTKSLVSEALAGLAYLNPKLALTDTTVHLREPNKSNVSLLCGGGAGHEPAHAAFVGDGMLTAAVSGQIFASPNAQQVEEALKKLSFTKGTLIIVKNYTGDVLQFGLAKERWAATHLGEDSVRLLVVGDDVSVPRSQGKLTGRRGLAATTIVYKIAGALAAKGASLDEVEHIAKIVANNAGTFGIGLEHCHVPGTEQSAEDYLKADEIEVGMGIHNEPGIRKVSPIPSTEKIVDELLTAITSTEDEERSFVPFKNDGKDEVILMVNNLGGLPELELAGVVNEAAKWLKRKHINVERAIAGSFMSSLNLPGFSISLVLLPREPVATSATFSSKLTFDKELLIDCFDAPTEAPGWRWSFKGRPEEVKVEEKEKVEKKEESDEGVKGPAPTDPKLFLSALSQALKLIIAAEPEITRYDTLAGDGDAGLTLKSGAEGVEARMASNGVSDKDVVKAMVAIGEVVEKEMGGTSGGLYSIFFSALAKGLLEAAKEKGEEKATAEVWARGLELALNTLYRYTLARPPSRTLIDPLASFILTFQSDPNNFNSAFEAARDAAEATRNIEATAGRAAYVDKKKLEEAEVPDAGAWGVLKALEGIKKVLDEQE
ncbi:Dak1 domain-domain-containing protein [Leucosporidium creatinivorum]|uniref:Dak1 domain-domain-containing protein n=1 Tax=Leucosporidium creatinivorum TaxID=106004 RepID=A0A1Y2EPC7_9BASI|nr:Dak1 domain-domain-containing protein [Leucosporidium creatinivorum]